MKRFKLNNFKTRRNMNFLTVFLCLDLLIIFSLLRTSNASYVADAVATADMDVALYAFSSDGLVDSTDSATINLGSFSPGETKNYKLEVKNTDSDGNVSDTNIVYSLKVITTNNIDLEYKLYRNSIADANLIEDFTGTVSNDGYGTEFVYYTIDSSCLKYESAQTDTYYLEVTFPEKYKTSNYQDLIESIKIQLESKQSVDDAVCETGG